MYSKTMCIIISLQGNTMAKQYAYTYHFKGTLYAYIKTIMFTFCVFLWSLTSISSVEEDLMNGACKGNSTYEDTIAEATACKYACMHIYVYPYIHIHNAYVRMSVHACVHCNNEAIPCSKLLVSSIEIRVHGFNPRPVNVGLVVEHVTLEQVFVRVLGTSPIGIIPLKSHNTIIHL